MIKQWEMNLTQTYNQQLMQLNQQYNHQKAALEQQAMQLTMEYQQKQVEEEMLKKQWQIQKEQNEAQQKFAMDMEKISRQAQQANPYGPPQNQGGDQGGFAPSPYPQMSQQQGSYVPPMPGTTGSYAPPPGAGPFGSQAGVPGSYSQSGSYVPPMPPQSGSYTPPVTTYGPSQGVVQQPQAPTYGQGGQQRGGGNYNASFNAPPTQYGNAPGSYAA